MGEWEGMGFQDIRARYPVLYELRGKDPLSNVPSGGESFEHCRDRAAYGLISLLAKTTGDIAVVTHAGVNRILLTSLLSEPLEGALHKKQPYGCINQLSWGRGQLSVVRQAVCPHPPLRDDLCKKMMDAVQTPEPVRKHCRAVARRADELARKLRAAGHVLNRPRLHAAALLHDIARAQSDHAASGAAWLEAVGYPEEAALIASHHDLDAKEPTLEEAVLFLADKEVLGEVVVGIQARFSASLPRCRTPEAREAHRRRWDRKKAVEAHLKGQLVRS